MKTPLKSRTDFTSHANPGHLTSRSDVYGFGVVLLEMLIGRQAMDKTRPSREHNLVEWARPLLIHNRKLLKILDPRVDGQYSIKSAQKLANLAYQCLSQNPKGRPTMSQVVEILESIQALLDDEALFQSSGSAVTLYEASRESLDGGFSEGRNGSKKSEGDGEEDGASGRRRLRDGRSRSEPALDSLSPDSGGSASHVRKGSFR